MVGLLLVVSSARAEEVATATNTTVTTGTTKPAVAVVAAKVDVLVYNDGDRVKGRLIDQSVDSWLFLSDRFGILRVPLADAKVILATPEAVAAVAKAKEEEARLKSDEAENASFLRWSTLSPLALAHQLRTFFGPWHGRFAFSTQTLSNTSETTNDTAEAHLQRKWSRDDVQLNARYDFADTNHVTTNDIIKADASWRHDFPGKLFSIYSPSLEWNRAYYINSVPSDYVLLQEEIGMGVNLFAKPKRNLRVGLAENVFDVWQTVEPRSHEQSLVESLFVEADWTLPWRMKLAERGAWYYSIANGKDGWENKIELDKKLTETFSIGIRHETRHNNPDVRVQDYSLLKLLMGVDF
ncbi:MAG: DUF481 domain-containing protein [Opitutaceae bacterium]